MYMLPGIFFFEMYYLYSKMCMYQAKGWLKRGGVKGDARNPPSFWQIRKRRRQSRRAAVLLAPPPDFQTFRHP